MALSATSYEILDDLLALRISNCTVTCPDEARDLRALRNAQMELAAIQRNVVMDAAITPQIKTMERPAVKLSRRMQRLVQAAHGDLQGAMAS